MSDQMKSLVSIVLRDLRSKGLDIKINDDGSPSLIGNVKGIPASQMSEFMQSLKGLRTFIIEFIKEEKATNETMGAQAN